MKDVPITVAIPFTIITSFFAWETKNGLRVVAIWFTKRLKEALKVQDADIKDDSIKP